MDTISVTALISATNKTPERAKQNFVSEAIGTFQDKCVYIAQTQPIYARQQKVVAVSSQHTCKLSIPQAINCVDL